MQLHKKHGDKVACISYSVDWDGTGGEVPQKVRNDVSAQLTNHGATFDNIISADDPNELDGRIDLTIPIVLVYDQSGTMVKRFDNSEGLYDGGFSYEEHIIPFVEELLKEKPAQLSDES